MLTGDRSKYFGLVFGVTFATLLMSQQTSIFMGIMKRTASQIIDVRDAPIWVMDNKVRYIDEVPGLPDTSLERVRGVEGVEWAVKLYKGQIRARLSDGNFRTVILFGLDDTSLVGAPQAIIAGQVGDLRRPDAVIIDKAGYEYLWPDEPATLPVIYTRYCQTTWYVPRERDTMSFVLARPKPGVSIEEACRQIERQTGLLALSQDQFFWKTIKYFLSSTGIPVNFGISITLGFLIGVAIDGQTIYLFTIENLKQFGALKAMGLSNGRIVGMILLQAVVVGAMGYGIGLGLAALFFESTSHITQMAGLHLYWQVVAGSGAPVMLIVVLASLLSIRRVLVLEPAVVFRG
jgi:putative ABC transport system permease protein